MAIFSFPSNPTLGQTYYAPNGVTYTWDGEKWLGSGSSSFFNPADFVEKTPDAGNEQAIIPGQPGDTALRLKGTTGQAANLLEFEDINGTVFTVFDEYGRLGIGTATPLYPIDVKGSIALTGGIFANNSFGTAGQHLVSDGTKAYWADNIGATLDQVLKNGNFSNEDATVGDLHVQGDLTVSGSSTIVNTEVIKLADNIITLNSNYTGNTPNENAGIEVNRGQLAIKRFYWDETLDRWSVGTDAFTAGEFRGPLIGNVTGQVSSLANHTTDGVREGGINLYFTQARARGALSTIGDIQYNPATGVFTYHESVHSVNGKTGHVVLNSDDIVEGNTNLYLTDANFLLRFGNRSINDLADVDTTAAQSGDVLYWDAANAQWLTRPGDWFDEMISSLVFNPIDGSLTAGRNDGNTFVTNLDGRYLNLTGGTLTGPVYGPSASFANVNVTDTLAGNNAVFETLNANNVLIRLHQLFDVDAAAAANGDILYWSANDSAWKTIAGDFFDGFVDNASFSAANGQFMISRNDGNTFAFSLDGRYLELANGGVVAGNTVFNGLLQTPTVPTTNNDVTNKAYVDALVANSEVRVSAFAWDDTTGNLTITEIDSTVWDVNLDGRYARSVNGIVPDANGNIAVNITSASTGTLGNIPATANSGDIYIVVGDPDANNNGETWIWTGTQWERIVSFDQAQSDIRYINTAGDTMTGMLSLAADPSQPMHAATKQYVDTLVANSEVTVNSFAFSSLDGNLVITETNGSVWAVDLDGRYIELPASANTGQVLTWDGVDWVPQDLSPDLFLTAANWDATTGNLTFTTSNGTVLSTDLDGRYLELANGGVVAANVDFTQSITANNGYFEYLDANNILFGINDLIDVDTTGVANGDVLYWDATANTWIPTEVTHPQPIIVANSAPTPAVLGMAWYDSDATSSTSGRTFIYDGTQWIDLAPASLANINWKNIASGAIPASSASITQPVMSGYRKIAVTLEDVDFADTVSVTGGLEVYGNCTDGSTVLIDSLELPTAEYPMSAYFEFFTYYNGGTSNPTTYLANKYKKTLSSIEIKPKNTGDSMLSGSFMIWYK